MPPPLDAIPEHTGHSGCVLNFFFIPPSVFKVLWEEAMRLQKLTAYLRSGFSHLCPSHSCVQIAEESGSLGQRLQALLKDSVDLGTEPLVGVYVAVTWST